MSSEGVRSTLDMAEGSRPCESELFQRREMDSKEVPAARARSPQGGRVWHRFRIRHMAFAFQTPGETPGVYVSLHVFTGL